MSDFLVRLVDVGNPPLVVGSEEHRIEWLPRLGPTSYLLVCALVQSREEIFSTRRLATAIGVSPAKIEGAMKRLTYTHHAELVDRNSYTVNVRMGYPSRPLHRRFETEPATTEGT